MKRTIVRWVLGILAVVAGGGVAYLVPALWFKPMHIDVFYARVFGTFMIRNPMLLTSMGLIETTPFAFHAGRLNDFSLAASERETQWLERELGILRQYDRRVMTPSQRMSAEVMDYFLDDFARAKQFQHHGYSLDQLQGFHGTLVDFMLTQHPLERPVDARNYVQRLRGFGVAVDQTLEGVAHREKNGIVPPRWVLENVREQLAAFAAPEVKSNVLYVHFAAAVRESIPGIAAKDSTRLLADAEAAVRDIVYPAWGRLMEVVERQMQTATSDDGVWKLPEGDRYYDVLLRRHTTTDMSADSIHALGRSEVSHLQAAMAAILARQGYRTGTVGSNIKRLRDEPRYRFGDDDAARDSILAGYRSILAEAEGRLGAYFDVRPAGALEVRRVPESREKGAPGAYYQSGTFDGSRPGVFYANLARPSETARPDMRTLAYHEGVPGHHFQIALAQEMKGVAFFRRVVPFTAYAEGWALYAERLALEKGFHPTAADSLGAIQAELFRAARLVVDTGIHRHRWTRRQAIDWMITNTGMDSLEVASEIDRYIVMPGQACAYKVGQLAILDLRERAMHELGDRFDLKGFHNAVLSQGALPLTLLEKVVDEWIASQKVAVKAEQVSP